MLVSAHARVFERHTRWEVLVCGSGDEGGLLVGDDMNLLAEQLGAQVPTGSRTSGRWHTVSPDGNEHLLPVDEVAVDREVSSLIWAELDQFGRAVAGIS